ncbi:MAG TPA: ScyD/ScyE family protein [Aggregatilineales bacterium]|nr:ScyD/ScyE family protein [Aggregatilineales bacterium]
MSGRFEKLLSIAGMIAIMLSLVIASFPAMAQDMPPLPGDVVIDSLGAPRGLAFDADGNLLIADAGTGGEVSLTLPGPEGETTMQLGLTGKVISVAPDGSASDRIPGFPSYASPSETTGLYRAIPQGDSLWVIFSGTGAATVGAFWTDSVVELDATTLAVKQIINLNHFESVNDPDGAGYDSNVTDIAWAADGTLYITDAGGNDLLSWTQEGGLQLVQAWTDNAVPTSIEIAENGDLYIGFLGAGIAPGAGRVEHWSNGELTETFGGLTGVTDILLDGDTLYAVQLFLFGEQGPGPGNVVMLNADGATPVAEGLMAPFGIAKGPDGALYVSYGTIALMPGMTGGVVKLSM